jgi:hypothetical protein
VEISFKSFKSVGPTGWSRVISSIFHYSQYFIWTDKTSNYIREKQLVFLSFNTFFRNPGFFFPGCRTLGAVDTCSSVPTSLTCGIQVVLSELYTCCDSSLLKMPDQIILNGNKLNKLMEELGELLNIGDEFLNF